MRDTLDKIVTDWLNERPRSEKTKANYRRIFRVYNNYIHRTTPYSNALGATPETVAAFKAHLEADYDSSATKCMYLSVVKMFHRYAYRTGKMSCDAARGLTCKSPRKHHNKKPLTDAQATALMTAVDTSTPLGVRDRVILLLMLHAGLRCVEVSRLDFDDIYLDAGSYRLKVQRKGHAGKDDVLKLRTDLGEELMRYRESVIAETLDTDGRIPMFWSLSTKNCGRIVPLSPECVSDIVTFRMLKAGVKGRMLSPHSLRHTYGCNLIRKGVPLEDVQFMMGHSSAATTMIYVMDAKEQRIDEHNPAELLDKL